jgi:hypothetical protein
MVEPCEVCGEDVNVFPGFGKSATMVVLCKKCIDNSRAIDGTLSDAFKKARGNA